MSVFMSPYSNGLTGANVSSFGDGSEAAPQTLAPNADRIRCASPPGAAIPAATRYAAYGGDNGGSGLAGFTNLMNGFIAGLQNLLASLGQQFALSPSGNTFAANAGGQQYFKSASASSTGDPHEAFNGVAGDATHVDGRWDSMQSHAHLLSSDSFAGGYDVSTVATTPGANGVTMNDSATIATGGGATKVSMTEDGSFDVSSYGRTVSLQQGQTVSLGNGDSVKLDADRSLIETDSNAAGGSISTTLRSNGQGGVDVSTSATGVDLGGYLVGRNDPTPALAMPAYEPTQTNPFSSALPSQTQQWSWRPSTTNATGNGDASVDVAPEEELA